MPYVEIYKLKNDGTQEVTVVCRLADNVVLCQGDKALTESLNNEGIKDYSKDMPTKLYPNDGLRFLEQLRFNFKSGYLNASEIKND